MSLAQTNKFRIKGLTRKLDSPKATELAQLENVEMVQADLDNKESLVKAFTGADGVFLVTVPFTLNPDTEIQQGKNAADAAKQAGVKHLVFSTLEDPRKEVLLKAFREPFPTQPGRIVPHFETKAEIEEYIRGLGIPATFLLTSFFYENFINLPNLKLAPGKLLLADNLGDAIVPAHSVSDIGETAAVVFVSPQSYAGKTIPIVGDLITMEQACSTIRSVVGLNMSYLRITDEQEWDLPYPGGIAKDLSNMFRFYRLYGNLVRSKRDLEKTVYKGPTFKEWAEAKKGAIRYKKDVGYVATCIMLLLLAASWVKAMLLKMWHSARGTQHQQAWRSATIQ